MHCIDGIEQGRGELYLSTNDKWEYKISTSLLHVTQMSPLLQACDNTWSKFPVMVFLKFKKKKVFWMEQKNPKRVHN